MKSKLLYSISTFLIAFFAFSSNAEAAPLSGVTFLQNNGEEVWKYTSAEPQRLFTRKELFPQAEDDDLLTGITWCQQTNENASELILLNMDNEVYSYDLVIKELTSILKTKYVPNFTTNYFASKCSPNQKYALGLSKTYTLVGGGLIIDSDIFIDLKNKSSKEIKINIKDSAIRHQYLNFAPNGDVLVLAKLEELNDEFILLSIKTEKIIELKEITSKDYEVLWRQRFNTIDDIDISDLYVFSDEMIAFVLELNLTETKLAYLNHTEANPKLYEIRLPNGEKVNSYNFTISGNSNSIDFLTLNTFETGILTGKYEQTVDYIFWSPENNSFAQQRILHLRDIPEPGVSGRYPISDMNANPENYTAAPINRINKLNGIKIPLDF